MTTPLIVFVMRRLREKGYMPMRMGEEGEVVTTTMIDRHGHCVDALEIAKDFQRFMKKKKQQP